MDKFLQLLNAYCKEQWIGFVYDEHEIDHEPTARWLVSKDFGFIKWLDKNKKIRWNTPLMMAIKDSFKPLFKEWKMWWRKGELIILMVLATSKKPLYDLYHYMLK